MPSWPEDHRHIYVVVWEPRVEVPYFEPKADAYFSDAYNRARVNPATKYKGPSICTWLKRRHSGRCALTEARIATSKQQPGRKRPLRMEFQPDVRSEKNKGIFSDRVLGLLTELHVERRSQKINAPVNCEFLSLDNSSIVLSP